MAERRATAGNGQASRPWIDGLITSGLPRDHFPAEGADPDTVCDVLTEELLLDGNSKQNLATFCQTWESPQVHRLMDLAIDKNLIDKDEYPQTAEIEQRCIALLADLWNAPGQPVGCSTVGSSEAAWRRSGGGGPGRRRPASLPTGPTWSAAACKSAGKSLPATGISRCGKLR